MTNLARKAPVGQKVPNLHDKRITDHARGQSCTMRLPCCDGGSEKTIFAHFRHFNIAGMGEKPPDFAGAFVCHQCHEALDLRNPKTAHLVTYEDMLRAMIETLRIQFRDGIFTVAGRGNGDAP